jgi:N-acetylmuramoyl-L-alanine amidase
MAKKILLILILIISFVTGIAGANKKFTLVIDPGHGGRDSGAPGAFSVEKNINLNVALAFGRYVEQNCPDVRVVYTRKTDVFIPLYERANIANNCKADLFISVHTNALKGVHTARGFETYTLGDGRSHAKETNLEVAKRENSRPGCASPRRNFRPSRSPPARSGTARATVCWRFRRPGRPSVSRRRKITTASTNVSARRATVSSRPSGSSMPE